MIYELLSYSINAEVSFLTASSSLSCWFTWLEDSIKMEERALQNYDYVASKVYDCDQPRGGATMIEVKVVLITSCSVVFTRGSATPIVSIIACRRIVVAQMKDSWLTSNATCFERCVCRWMAFLSLLEVLIASRHITTMPLSTTSEIKNGVDLIRKVACNLNCFFYSGPDDEDKLSDAMMKAATSKDY